MKLTESQLAGLDDEMLLELAEASKNLLVRELAKRFPLSPDAKAVSDAASELASDLQRAVESLEDIAKAADRLADAVYADV